MVREVLLTCLVWYVDWCDDLLQQQMCENLIDTWLIAFTLAEKFRALCAKSKGGTQPEQRAISRYLVFQAMTEQVSFAAPLLKEALEWDPHNDCARSYADTVRSWQIIIEKWLPYIQEYSSKDLRKLFNRDPVLLRSADQYPLVYLMLNRIPPPAYRKPQIWSKSKASPGRASVDFKPAQLATTRQSSIQPASVKIDPPKVDQPAAVSSASWDPQLVQFLEGGKKALAAQRYDDAFDYLTRAQLLPSSKEQRRAILQQFSQVYTMKGERLLPEIQRRKSDGSPYFSLLRTARTDFKQALSYDPENQVAREYLAQLEA